MFLNEIDFVLELMTLNNDGRNNEKSKTHVCGAIIRCQHKPFFIFVDGLEQKISNQADIKGSFDHGSQFCR